VHTDHIATNVTFTQILTCTLASLTHTPNSKKQIRFFFFFFFFKSESLKNRFLASSEILIWDRSGTKLRALTA